MGSLLEVGTGFHPELTGRENIYLNGAIPSAMLRAGLGMKRAEIERKFDEIVAFAEVEKFMDTPVKHYLEPEILLVDEVLAANGWCRRNGTGERRRNYGCFERENCG